MNGMRPMCECGNPALARVEIMKEAREESAPAHFRCEECMVRATRVASAQGQLLDVLIHAPRPEAPPEVVDPNAPPVIDTEADTNPAIVTPTT